MLRPRQRHRPSGWPRAACRRPGRPAPIIKIGVEDYILKPISKSDVSEIIVKLVNSLQKERKDKEIEKVLEKITTVDTQDNIAKNNYKELIQNIIEESYTDSQFTLSVLSEKLDLSSGYLSIMFKKNFGIPFQDYLLQKRMEKTKLLLTTILVKLNRRPYSSATSR